MKKLSAILVLMILILGCSDDEKGNWVLPPNTSLTIGFNDTSKMFDRIPKDSVNNSERPYLYNMVYYLDDNKTRIYDKYTILSPVIKSLGETPSYPFYLVNIGNVAVNSLGGQTWYIDWPNGQTDTLFANYKRDTKGPNDCNCSEPLVKLTLNNSSYIEKTTFDSNGVYVFE